MLDITTRPGGVDFLVDAMVWLVGHMPADPKQHFGRSRTTTELDRTMTARPHCSTDVRARDRCHFDPVAVGRVRGLPLATAPDRLRGSFRLPGQPPASVAGRGDHVQSRRWPAGVEAVQWSHG